MPELTIDQEGQPYKVQVDTVIQGVMFSQDEGYDAIRNIQRGLNTWLEEHFPDFKVTIASGTCAELELEENG